MYHYVRPIKSSPFPNIKGLEVEYFKRQIEFFQKFFHFISMQDVLDCVYQNKELPHNSILLTFDDGFKDHYQHVFPLLKKLEINAAFFPPALPIVENRVLDVHKIHFILDSTSNYQLIVDEIFHLIKKFSIEFELKKPEEYFSELAISSRFDNKEIVFIKRILQRNLPPTLRSKITDLLFKKFIKESENDFSSKLYMNIDEMHEMVDDGMYFGSHSYSHQWLSYLSSEELKIELDNSIKFCDKVNSGTKNLVMCYPYGDYNQNTITQLIKSGFKAGLTTKVGDATISKPNIFSLERYDTNDFPQ
jgi:peptidoglycan/xylan/chitin deacetylase (PgdA/CDA1 family)